MHIFHWTASCVLSRMGVTPIKHLLNHLYHHPSSHPFFRLSFAAACVGSSTTVRQLVCCDYWALYLFLVFPHLWSQGVSQTCLTGEGLFLVWCFRHDSCLVQVPKWADGLYVTVVWKSSREETVPKPPQYHCSVLGLGEMSVLGVSSTNFDW